MKSVFSSLKMSWMVSRRAGVLMTWSRIRRGVDRVPSRYRPGPQNRSMYLSLPSRAFVCGRTMFAQPPKYLLTIRCFFNEASVGASKNVASAINVENLGSSRWRRIELYQIQEHFLRSLFSQSEPLRSCDSAHNRSDSRAIPSCHRRTMHHQHILPIVAFSCGGEIEPAYLHGGAIHEHKRVMHDGIVVIYPHRHTLIRQELRRRVSRRGVDLSTTTCTSTPRLPPSKQGLSDGFGSEGIGRHPNALLRGFDGTDDQLGSATGWGEGDPHRLSRQRVDAKTCNEKCREENPEPAAHGSDL